MKTLPVIALLVTLAASSKVLKFRQHHDEEEQDVRDLMQVLMKSRSSYFQNHKIHGSTKVTKFIVQNCGDPKKETALVQSLNVTPDPVVLPGNINIQFAIDNLKAANAPIPAVVKIKKKVLSDWITVPCIDQFGSCTYEDFCQILALIPSCPDPFVEHNIPCQCPFAVGNFSLPTTQFYVPVSFLPAGDYFGQLNMTMNSAPLTCYQVYISLA